MGHLNYGPFSPTEVPTLGGWMLVLLSFLLISVAYWASKKKGSRASKFFITLIGISGLVGISGIKLISEVEAVQNFANLSSPAGGTMIDIKNFVSNTYTNTSGVTQQITLIDVSTISCANYKNNPSAQTCQLNVPLVNNASCEIDCRGLPPS